MILAYLGAGALLAGLVLAAFSALLSFWAGGTENGKPHYYRVQGPTFVLELDNTQNDANHVHALWRDFEHDFGGDPLAKHYQASHTP